MYRLTSKLIIYRNIGEDSILKCLSDISYRFAKGEYEKEALVTEILEQIHRLLDVATRYGFDRNLWHNYLAYLLATTETPFTLVSEKVGAHEGSVNLFARNDLEIFRQLFAYDFGPMEEALGINVFSVISDYKAVGKAERIFNRSVSEKVQKLSAQIEGAQDAQQMYDIVTGFYKDYGVGKLGLNRAFRVNEDALRVGTPDTIDTSAGELIVPITAVSDVQLEDLVGYEIQKQKLIANTEAFVHGRIANNVLLYGDAGTGKSTSIKAILNRYYDQGLRMIEIYKHQFRCLQQVVAEIKNRNYRFIIYMDDLSFEEFETEYKYLKAVIEGGLETKPENVLIYATSNRRHLIRETWDDRNDRSQDELHRSDTVQEKTSLAARFGVQIGYLKPSHKEYLHIVKELAARYPQIKISEEELLLKANQWELRGGGTTGRSAQQFINFLAGSAAED